MRKLTNLLVALLALFGTVISARADVIASPALIALGFVSQHFWVVVLVIVVVIVTLTLLRIFRKK